MVDQARRAMTRRRAMALGVLVGVESGASASARPTTSEAAGAMQIFLFIYRPGPSWRAGVPLREQGLAPHAAYMQQLQDRGRLFAGGGFASDDGGMAVVLAADQAEAEAMLAADPAMVSGIFLADLKHWRPRFRVDTPLP